MCLMNLTSICLVNRQSRAQHGQSDVKQNDDDDDMTSQSVCSLSEKTSVSVTLWRCIHNLMKSGQALRAVKSRQITTK